MPQVDKVTYLPIIFWSFIIYTGGYLLLSATTLYSFLTGLKLSTKRLIAAYGTGYVRGYLASSLKLLPWISL